MKKTGSLLQSHNYHTARCNLRLVLNDPRTRSPGYFKAAVNFLDMVLVLYFLFLFLRRVLFLWFVRQLQAWLTRNSHAHTPVTGSAHKHSAWSGISSSRADKQENRKTYVNTYRSAYERRHSFRGSYSCSNRSFLCCLWIFFSFLMMLSRCSNSSFLLPHTTGSRSPTRPVSHFPAPVSALVLCVLCVMPIRPVSVLSVFMLFVRAKKLGCREACGGEEDLMSSSTLKLKCLPKLLGGFKLMHQGGKARGGGAGGRRDSNKISVHRRRPQLGSRPRLHISAAFRLVVLPGSWERSNHTRGGRPRNIILMRAWQQDARDQRGGLENTAHDPRLCCSRSLGSCSWRM